MGSNTRSVGRRRLVALGFFSLTSVVAAAAHAQEAARPAKQPPTIEVELAADHPQAGLYRIVGVDRGIDGDFNGSLAGTRRRLRLCTAPCRLSVPPGDYLVGGQRLRESRTFSLTGRNAHVRVDADVGTEGAMMGGMVLAGVGGFTLLVSLPIVIVGSVLAAQDKGSGVLIGGGVAAAAGAGMLAGGLSLVIGSKTTVSLQTR